ncbi:cilia- and flagella-associated protein 45 [Trichogramma pretiosum]|uniref:cilia- and flagella-associated protein 45 n=1 Tax=Trichogramma pretiosum TaxID=7493 RepID=UPI0006C97C4F|nr:cilia- and flagella-associated protein 45 [Trichogramma pretiosum]
MSVKSAGPVRHCNPRSSGASSSSANAANRSKFPAGNYSIHTPKQCQQVLNKRPIHLKRCAYDGKEILQVFEKNRYRHLLVPSKEPTIYPKIISNTEFLNILERCRIPSKEEKEASYANAERMRERLLRESMARKESVRRMDLKRNRDKQQGQLSDIEEETRRRTMALLEQAEKLKIEQEEEMKLCNKLILETKCRAVRDAQVAEKEKLRREYEAAEKRLNDLMERQRLEALRQEDDKSKLRAEQSADFAKVLHEQIRRNEEERMLEYERKREESRLANLNALAQQELELERARQKEAEIERARKQLIEANEQLKHFKSMEKEEERVMDRRIREFLKARDDRETRLQQEAREEFERREREKSRLADQALQAKELQAQIEELNATRIQEEVEREWRRKEKEEAIKKADSQKKLKIARDDQLQWKIKIQAMEIEREKREYESILALQKEALCREQKIQEMKKRQAMVHRSEILKQVNEKEKERIMSRQKMFEEGLAIRTEIDQRKKRLREAMERKCQEMRENSVPDIYVNEVQRMIDNIDNNK